MSVLVRAARILALLAGCAPAHADAPSIEALVAESWVAESWVATQTHVGERASALVAAPENKAEQSVLGKLTVLAPNRVDSAAGRTAPSTEPFGLLVTKAAPSAISAKWTELESRIRSERETLAACRSGDGSCLPEGRRFLNIVELGRRNQGRARLEVINRAVNLSIRPVSDFAQYGVEDFWSPPLATLSHGAGDCKDYAILKYVTLQEAGIAPEYLRLVIVRVAKRDTLHAVLAVRLDEEWLILDNRMLIMRNAMNALHYDPLFVLDDRGARASLSAPSSPAEPPAGR
jgi:predicted transglutaminase-like cysteine proteinase